MPPIRRVPIGLSILLALSASPVMAECDMTASVFFEYGSSEILTSGRQTLNVLASQLPSGSQVLLRGHVSQTEAGDSALADLDRNRAANAASDLSAAAGAKPVTVESEGAGSAEPYAPEGPNPLFDRRVDVWVCPVGA